MPKACHGSVGRARLAARPVGMRLRRARPEGPGRRGRAHDPDRFAGDHAGHRHTDDRRYARVRMVVPGRQPRARYRPDWEYLRSDRAARLVGAAHDHHAAGRRRLDRLAHARPGAGSCRRMRPPLEVQVTSLDWKWLFIYPDRQVAAVNELVIPTGVPVRFTLTSASVMNAFFIPGLGSMLYSMNGMANRAEPAGGRARHLPRAVDALSAGTASRTWRSRCERCRRRSSPSWLDQTAAAASGPTLDAQSYAELAQQSSKVAPFTYRAVDPGLFHRIVTQEPAARTRALRRDQSWRRQASGELGCWAS